jgi:long-chain acyl-CoA synthetase
MLKKIMKMCIYRRRYQLAIKTLGDITRVHRATVPKQIALHSNRDAREWTYESLDIESCQCANALIAMGIGNQDRVAFLDKNAPEYFTFLFGIAKLGAVSVAVNWRLAAPEMEYILNHSQAKVLLIGEEFLGHLSEMDLELKNIVVLGDPGDSGYPTYEQWIAGQSEQDPNIKVAPEDTCYQLYTSGTTGLPKGVETTHDNMISMMSNGLAPIGFDSRAINLVCMPLFHISGSGWGVIGLYSGCKSVLLRDVDMQEILQVIPEHGVTHTIFVPAVLQFLLAQPNIDEIDFSSLQSVTYGASPITEEVLVKSMKTFKAKFFQVYGLTETTGGVTMLHPDEHDPGGPRSDFLRSCGKVIEGSELKIVNRENGEDMPEGEVGEIWIRGPQVMKGYWRNDEATTESIDDDGWFKSGDAGYLREDFLFIHDRVKDMIISGGENIYPAEIENVLMSHPAIADAAVIGVPDERWGETVKAIVTRVSSDEGNELSEDEVFSYCRKNLANYKCPTSIDWMETIPRNPSGKILKTELRKPYWKDMKRNVS